MNKKPGVADRLACIPHQQSRCIYRCLPARRASAILLLFCAAKHRFVSGFLFSSVQFSKNISIAQLSRMSHCAPEVTLNPTRLLKFTPETVVRNVFVAQVCWQAVPDTWPSKCVVCAWNSARSVGRRAKPASRTFRDLRLSKNSRGRPEIGFRPWLRVK